MVVTSNDAKCRWPCTGVAMPAWCATVEVDPARDRPAVARHGVGGDRHAGADRTGSAERAGACEQVPAS